MFIRLGFQCAILFSSIYFDFGKLFSLFSSVVPQFFSPLYIDFIWLAVHIYLQASVIMTC